MTFLHVCHSWFPSLIIFCLSFTFMKFYIKEMSQAGLFFRTLDKESQYLFSRHSSEINYLCDLRQIS